MILQNVINVCCKHNFFLTVVFHKKGTSGHNCEKQICPNCLVTHGRHQQSSQQNMACIKKAQNKYLLIIDSQYSKQYLAEISEMFISH